ncbi:hypothetical protein GLOIN_2v1789591 [Rhizophagus clarus]|uniref:Uncharacterized protein n=1 Tax=Rhizophagus clarus TaxID=94130 RepID=A0A8H3QVS7_9GLOM|nr:hypothetical protein GLOIN_2v1789591 [Rhizophagus clarus]
MESDQKHLTDLTNIPSKSNSSEFSSSDSDIDEIVKMIKHQRIQKHLTRRKDQEKNAYNKKSCSAMLTIDNPLEAGDTLNWSDQTPPPTSPTLEPEKGKDNPVPVQENQLLNEFFEEYKEYKAHTSLSGPDLRREVMKKVFFRSLNQEAKIQLAPEEHSDPFQRLSEILVKLDVPSNLRLQILLG